MKVTFYYDKLCNVKVNTENCTFEFLTESYHSFLKISDGLKPGQKLNLKLTFEKN